MRNRSRSIGREAALHWLRWRDGSKESQRADGEDPDSSTRPLHSPEGPRAARWLAPGATPGSRGLQAPERCARHRSGRSSASATAAISWNECRAADVALPVQEASLGCPAADRRRSRGWRASCPWRSSPSESRGPAGCHQDGRDRGPLGIPPVVAGYGVRDATNSLAGSVDSVLVNIVRNWPPAGASPT
jgi:hypothetical protein